MLRDEVLTPEVGRKKSQGPKNMLEISKTHGQRRGAQRSCEKNIPAEKAESMRLLLGKRGQDRGPAEVSAARTGNHAP